MLQTTELNENMRWLHILTNGKKLVSAYYLTEQYDAELKGCKHELIEMQPTGNKNHDYKNRAIEFNAIGKDGTNHGLFYSII